MNTQARQLAKVKAQNRVNAFVNAAVPALLETFRPFIGCKILLQSGDKFCVSVRNHIAATVEKLNETAGIRWRLDIGRYSVQLKADASEQGDGVTYYQEQTHYLLDITGDTLKGLYDSPQHKAEHKTDYTVEWVEAQKKEIALAEGKVSSLKSSVSSFERWHS